MSTQDVEGGEYVQSEGGAPSRPASQRRSHAFCGICDMRIGTYFVNVVHITLIVVGVLVAAIRGPLFWQALWGSFGIGLPGLILSGIGIYGARTFELWAMYLATAGFLVAFVIQLIFLEWIGSVICAVILYPHLFLTYEIRSGIMTKETYEKEEYLVEGGREMVDKAYSYLDPRTAAA